MSSEKPLLPARDRIMTTAFDLFYRQGYRATGINQVISESGVAKASFYDHFPSKEDLLVLYAAETARREQEDMRRQIDAFSTPQERFFAPLRILIPWFESSDYRGCPFQNLLGEISDGSGKVRAIAKQHRETARALFEELAHDLIAAEPAYDGVDVEELAKTYLLLFEGAIATAVAYRSPWPVEQAIASLRHHLETKG